MKQLQALVLALLAIPVLTKADSLDESLVEKGDWQLSVALGAGRISNPLIDGDAFPLFVAPAIKYYGESLFFDNGTLGYTFTEQADFAVSLTTNVNTNARYFKRWHPDNWFISTVFNPAASQDIAPDWQVSYYEPNPLGEAKLPENVTQYRLNNLADRDWSLDAGLQLNWFIGPNSQIITQWNRDVSSVHYGTNIQLEWNYNFALMNIGWNLTLGANWQDQKLNTYYFGLSEKDKAPLLSQSNVSSTWLPFARLSASYQLNHSWSLIGTAHVQDFSALEERSPIVNESYQYTIFAGFRYDF